MNILDFTDYRKTFPVPKSANKAHSDEIKMLKFIDNLLIKSGIEEDMVSRELKDNGIIIPSLRKIQFYRQRIRINILMGLKGEAFRTFEMNSACHSLRLWFTFYPPEFQQVFPSKSTLQRISSASSADTVKAFIHGISGLFLDDVFTAEYLGDDKRISFTSLYGDSTCVEANIHYPVDWLLIRDAIRSIISSILVIRQNYFTHKMPLPQSFLSRINSLCIEMSAAYNTEGARKKRKKVLRKMFKLLSQVVGHGIRYGAILLSIGIKNDKKRQLIFNRLKSILDQAPTVLRNCRRRMISEKTVANSDKILSLYDPNIHIVVRKKSGKRNEFGNGLFLCEQSQGLILQWTFFKDHPPADSNLLAEALEEIRTKYRPIQSFGGDRGFDSKVSRDYLDDHSIVNAIARRSVPAFMEQLEDETFVKHQKRRAQTEGRISTVKHVFLKRVFRQKGFENKERSVNWGIFAHNLTVLFRISQEDKKETLRQIAL